MYYLVHTYEGLKTYDGFSTKIIDQSMKYFLNQLLIEEHATLEGRLTALRQKYSLKNNVPIYIHDTCCFYTTKHLRAYGTIAINYHAVLSMRERNDGSTEYRFKNLSALHVDLPYHTMVRKHIRTQTFLESHGFL